MFRKLSLAIFLFILSIYAMNASWLRSPPETGVLKIISHRGVHQTYDRTGLGRDDCTATRIHEQPHHLLENTIVSMEAAFSAGASVVELDIHPTTDGRFAVFHDWTLDCRTDGSGITREHSLVDLQTLDIGYGYSADGEKSFPFRGQGIGKMPSLKQVFERFPQGRFLVNFKSKDPSEADRLGDMVQQHPRWKSQIWGVYGGSQPTLRMKEHIPDIRAFTKADTKSCVKMYIALGWSGYVPAACRNVVILIPSDYANWLWGWPNAFLERMHESGTEVVVAGSTEGSGGIDRKEQLSTIPPGFGGYVWTNAIEIIGPILSQASSRTKIR